MKTTSFDDALKILAILNKWEDHEEVYWRTDGEWAPVTFWIRCNDLFYWGCADNEEITADRVEAYDRACSDCKALNVPAPPVSSTFYECWGAALYCCRMRGMRPQKPYYKHIPEALWPLFNACGPERTT